MPEDLIGIAPELRRFLGALGISLGALDDKLGEEVGIGRVRTVREGAMTGTARVPIQIPVQHENARISAKLASNAGGRNVTVSLFYHDYVNGGA
jgi:hypothetical protein